MKVQILLSLIILLVIPIPSFAETTIMCEDEICAEECILMSNCILSWQPELQNPLTFQTDKKDYYIDDTIFINGTITDIDWSKNINISYDVTSLTDYITIGSGSSNSLQNNGTFIFIIDTNERARWTEHSSDVLFTITIQDFSNDYTFYSSSKANMENEILYNKIETLITKTDSHDTMLNSHDPMIYDNNNNILNITNTIIDLKLENEELKNQFYILGGYLTNINTTLGEFPPVLNANDHNKIVNIIEKLDDGIKLEDSNTASFLIQLKEAIENDQTDKIEKLINSAGSSIFTRDLMQIAKNMIYLELDYYNQN